MKAGVTASVVAHATFLALALIGLSAAKPLEPEVVESIAVELVPISEVTNIRMGSLDSTVVETETPAVVETETPPELAQPTGNTTEDQVTPAETPTETPAPVVNTAPEPVPEPVVEPEPTLEPEPTPVEPVPAVEPEPAPVEEAAPTEIMADVPAETPTETAAAPMPMTRPAALNRTPAPKKPEEVKVAEVTPAPKTPTVTETPKKPAQKPADEAAKEADQVAALINSETSRGATTGQGGTPTLGKNTGRASTLTQSQLDGLVAQIKGCMNIPAGAAEAGITAQLQFNIDGGGNVTGTPQIVSAPGTQLERALASAAQRAVVRCGPYQMAVNQEVKATFDPRELL
jgi:outer membrane biosynthesis protein TonB